MKHLPLVLFILLAACASPASSVAPPDVEEVRDGILMGYLSDDERPDSLALLPPPPEEGSPAYAADVAAAEATFALRGSERFQQAIADADLHFPAAAQTFTDALGFEVTEAGTPWLYQVLRRVLADAGLSTYGAKDHYARKRPFMMNGQPIGTPEEEESLRKDGSYPSGHTAAGWAWALVLAEVVPSRADAILKRGYEFGLSRTIINVHWMSDVQAGRTMAAAAVARLHANEEFRHALEKAKAEAAQPR